MLSTYTLSSFFISLLCILTAHCLLTRKKSIKFCIVTFILNTLFIFINGIYVTIHIQNPTIVKFSIYLIAFLYIVYFHLIFKESISKKAFTMFSIWLSSTIALLIAIKFAELISSVTNVEYFQNLIYIIRNCIQIFLLIIAYIWISKPYKTILNLVSDKTIRYMSLYPVIAFLLIITNFTTSSGRLTNFNSIYATLLFLAFIISGYILVFAGISSASQILSLQCNMKKLELDSKTDPLTGLYNRRYILEKLEYEFTKYKRTKNNFSIIIADIDLFKKINDRFGHDCGDRVLKIVSQSLRDVVREQDSVCRWGGEEFLILLPGTEIEGAHILSDRIRKIIEELNIEYEGVQVPITMTFGVTVNEDYEMINDTIKKADKAMYEGKTLGRNCVILG
ncbi:MAG: diguanylate cyclase (GGDEF)-like protein [Clostridium sp.]|jgi:diguanylate cyclase (GGDEF)-like protein